MDRAFGKICGLGHPCLKGGICRNRSELNCLLKICTSHVEKNNYVFSAKKVQIESTIKKPRKTEKFFKSLGLNGGGWHLASKVAV